MTDYYPLIVSAIAGLDKKIGVSRRALYERTRTTLVAHLCGLNPPLTESEITQERLSLEEAIRKVEAEISRRSREAQRPELNAAARSGDAAQFEEKPQPNGPAQAAAPPEAKDEEPALPPPADAPQPRGDAPELRWTIWPRPRPERAPLTDNGLKGFRDLVAETLGEANAQAAKSARQAYATVPDSEPEPADRSGPRVEPSALRAPAGVPRPSRLAPRKLDLEGDEPLPRVLDRHAGPPGGQGAVAATHSMSEVRTWLEGIGLGQYADAFDANDIDMDLLKQIDDQALRDIGITSAGHRLRLRNATAELAPTSPVKANAGSGIRAATEPSVPAERPLLPRPTPLRSTSQGPSSPRATSPRPTPPRPLPSRAEEFKENPEFDRGSSLEHFPSAFGAVESAPDSMFVAFPYGKPVSTFPGNALKGLAAAVLAVLLGLALGAALFWQRDRIKGWMVKNPAPPASQPGSNQPQSKIADRLNPARQNPAANGQADPNVAAVAQRVVLYDDDPADAQVKRYVGSVIWRTETVSPGPGHAPELAVRADLEIPDRRIAMTMSLRRNTDKALPASHTVEVRFNLPSDFPFGGISDVPGIMMNQAEALSAGARLAGVTVKVTSGFYMIGLSAADADMQPNLQLLKEWSWFNIPIVYNNGRRAILAVEKGTPGKRAFNQAFAAWGE